MVAATDKAATDDAATGQLALRKLRHADEELVPPGQNGAKGHPPRARARGAKR